MMRRFVVVTKQRALVRPLHTMRMQTVLQNRSPVPLRQLKTKASVTERPRPIEPKVNSTMGQSGPSVKETMTQKASAAKEALAQTANSAKEKTLEAKDSLSDKAHNAYEKVKDKASAAKEYISQKFTEDAGLPPTTPHNDGPARNRQSTETAYSPTSNRAFEKKYPVTDSHGTVMVDTITDHPLPSDQVEEKSRPFTTHSIYDSVADKGWLSTSVREAHAPVAEDKEMEREANAILSQTTDPSDSFSDQAHSTYDAAADKARAAKDKIAEKATAAKDTIKDKANDAKETLSKKFDDSP